MGFECAMFQHRIIRTTMHRQAQWDKVDFGYYTQCVFGKSAQSNEPVLNK